MNWNPNRFGKYGVAPKSERMCDNILFASKTEKYRYIELKAMRKAGHIKDLELQPRYELQPEFVKNGKKYSAIVYVPDFQYFDIKNKKLIIEDVKGLETDVFKLKHRMFEYKYPELHLKIV